MHAVKMPNNQSEDVIKPSLVNFTDIFEGESFQKKMKSTVNTIPMSNIEIDFDSEFEAAIDNAKAYLGKLQKNMIERYPDLDLESVQYVKFTFTVERKNYPKERLALQFM